MSTCRQCIYERNKVCTYDYELKHHKSIADIYGEIPIWCPLVKENDVNITHFDKCRVSKKGKVHFYSNKINEYYFRYKESYCKTLVLDDQIQKKEETHLSNYCKSCINKIKYGNDCYLTVWLHDGKFYEGLATININIKPFALNVNLFSIRTITGHNIEKFKKDSNNYMSLKTFVKLHHIDIEIKSYKIWLKKEK